VIHVAITQTVYNVHHFLAFNAIGAFFCEQLTINGWFSRLDPDIVCLSSDHYALMVPALLAGLLWLVFIPIHLSFYNHKYQQVEVGDLFASSTIRNRVLSIFNKTFKTQSPKQTQSSNRRLEESGFSPTSEDQTTNQSIVEAKPKQKSGNTQQLDDATDDDDIDEVKEERWKKKVDKHVVFVRDLHKQWASWHQILFLRKTILPLAIMVSERGDPEAQAGTMIFIVALFYFLGERFNPYRLKRFNNLETLASEIIIINLAFKDLITVPNPLLNGFITSLGWISQSIFYFKVVQLYARNRREERWLRENPDEVQAEVT
jgi:hypothetical protein